MTIPTFQNPFQILVSIIFLAVLLTCNPFDKEFSCKSRLYITISNQTADTIIVTLTDSTKVWYSNKVDVHIYHDSLSISPQMISTDSIDYQWKESVECSYNGERNCMYMVQFESRNNLSTIENKYIFPYDTTETYISLCNDCLNLSYDTMVIK